jgi:hypothetical protein
VVNFMPSGVQIREAASWSTRCPERCSVKVAEDEGGSVGVVDGFAGGTVEGLVQDAVADVLHIGAVEVLQLCP